LACGQTCAFAQAFTAPEGVGSVLVESGYAVTDRLSATIGIPYVFAKYTGANAPISGLPIDTCRCWQSSFQDFSASARYRIGGDVWAVAPLAGYGFPSHNYGYVGEAVVGKNLKEGHVGVSAGLRLAKVLPKASVQTTYIYSIVEKPIDTIGLNRSNLTMDFGYMLTSRIFVRGVADLQRTHGGLRFGSPTGNPFLPPGEVNTPARFAQRDRLLRSNFWHLGAGTSFDAGPVDVFASFTKYVNGTDTHNGWVFTTGTSWYFDLKN
jgi:hypothetical protein